MEKYATNPYLSLLFVTKLSVSIANVILWNTWPIRESKCAFHPTTNRFVLFSG